MKRLLVTLDFPPEKGGIQKYLDQIVRHTFSSEDMVVVGTSGKVSGRVDAFPCRVQYCFTPLSRFNKKFSTFPLFLKVFTCVRKKSADRIECGNIYAAVAPFLVSLFLPVGYNVYTYGTELTVLGKRGIRPYFLRKVLLRAETIYVLGSYTEMLLRRCGIRKPVTKVPPRITVRVPEEKVGHSDYTELLNVGRLVYHKGQDNLLRAVSRLPSALRWRLTIVGDGPRRKALGELAEELGIEGRVRFLGNVEDTVLEKEYQKASLFIFPSREDTGGTEGFGIVLLEAMNHGVPIIASRTGGITEVLDEGECGMLVNPDDPSALASAIIRLAVSKRLQKEYALKASKRLREKYAW